MTTPTASRPPAGMPPHLWELAKRDARGSVPERLRDAPDTGAGAPPTIRAVARRAATVGATLGVAAVAGVFGAGAATADAPVGGPVGLSGATGTAPPTGGAGDVDGDVGGPGGSGPGSGSAGGPGGGASFDATAGTSGSTADGPVSSGLGTTFQVQEGPPGAEQTITVSIFQDVTVVETADGMFQVDAYQYIVITDSAGNEYVFKEHYQVTVPDPPGQETDLVIHETGHVHIVENADGSFTPVTVDHGISVTTGSDGDGRDEIGITQQESVRITEHGTPDGDDLITILDERARTSTEDVGDEAHTTIDQATSTGTGPAPTVAGPVLLNGSSRHPWDEQPGGNWDELDDTTVPPTLQAEAAAPPLGSSLATTSTVGSGPSEPFVGPGRSTESEPDTLAAETSETEDTGGTEATSEPETTSDPGRTDDTGHEDGGAAEGSDGSDAAGVDADPAMAQ